MTNIGLRKTIQLWRARTKRSLFAVETRCELRDLLLLKDFVGTIGRGYTAQLIFTVHHHVSCIAEGATYISWARSDMMRWLPIILNR